MHANSVDPGSLWHPGDTHAGYRAAVEIPSACCNRQWVQVSIFLRATYLLRGTHPSLGGILRLIPSRHRFPDCFHAPLLRAGFFSSLSLVPHFLSHRTIALTISIHRTNPQLSFPRERMHPFIQEIPEKPLLSPKAAWPDLEATSPLWLLGHEMQQVAIQMCCEWTAKFQRQ